MKFITDIIKGTFTVFVGVIGTMITAYATAYLLILVFQPDDMNLTAIIGIAAGFSFFVSYVNALFKRGIEK